MAYNLYADQLLGTKLVPDFVYSATQQYLANPNGKKPSRAVR